MKTCTVCKEEKAPDQFPFTNKAKGKLSAWCRGCHREYDQQRWQRPERRAKKSRDAQARRDTVIQFLWDYLLAHPCACGEADPVVLEFDHRDGTTKAGSVCDLVRHGYSQERIQVEIDKCDVRCANCHRRRTAEQFGWYKRVDRRAS